MIEHPALVRPADHAIYRAEKMGKATLFSSDRMLVGLNAFEPGQEHALHGHEGMDKLYLVLEGEGLFLLRDERVPMCSGELLVAPAGVPHGVCNSGDTRLLLLAVLAPGPSKGV